MIWAKLEDVCDLITDGTHNMPQLEDSGVPLLDGADIDRMRIYNNAPKKFISVKTDQELSVRCKPKTGDVLISSRGSIGKIAIVMPFQNFNIMGNIILCRPQKTHLNSGFLAYYLLKENAELQKTSRGSSQKGLYLSQVRNIRIPILSLEIQKKIADVLDKAQDLIDKRKEQIEKMDEFEQSVFFDMFGDPIQNNKGWSRSELGTMCDIYRGGSPRPISDYLGGTVPWIKIGDATGEDSIYLTKTKEHIIESGISKSRLVRAGSMIFANCGVSLGFARILKFDGCIHDGWLSFENISDDLNEIFMLKLLNNCTEYFRRTAPEGTQPNLNTSIMKAFKIIVPPLAIQTMFAYITQRADQQKSLMQKSLTEMEYNFNNLMQMAFQGELF